MSDRSSWIAGAAAVALLLTGCQATAAEEASGSAPPAEAVTLTLAHIDGGTALDPAVDWFADRVAEISDGAVTVEIRTSCCGREPDVEERLVDLVASGEVDLGWVGTRVFADLGVTELSALTAPMVVDSYALQREVIVSDAAAEALAAVERLGVEPLALQPGAMRHPLGTDAALGAPADWQDVPVATFHSTQNAESLELLGAEPLDVGFDERDAGLADGTIRAVENSLAFLDGDREALIPYASVDVALWPRVSALIGAPGLADSVGEGVVGILRDAAAETADLTGDLRTVDQIAVRGACLLGATMATVGEDAVGALRDAFEPKLEELRRDARTGPLLEAVEESKAASGGDEPLTIPPDCAAE